MVVFVLCPSNLQNPLAHFAQFDCHLCSGGTDFEKGSRLVNMRYCLDFGSLCRQNSIQPHY